MNEECETRTDRDNTGSLFVVAFNYGGRQRSCVPPRQLARRVLARVDLKAGQRSTKRVFAITLDTRGTSRLPGLR